MAMSASIRGSTRNSSRRNAHGGQRVDLLIRVHRAELRREGRAGSARHDDGGHDAADLAVIAIATRLATKIEAPNCWS